METRYGQLNSARKRLARIRCLDHCVTCLRECKPLPKSLCYVPKEVKYKVTKTTRIPLYRSPGPDNHELSSLIIFVPNIHVVNEDTTKSQNNTDKYPVLVTSGEEVCNSQGQWARFLKVDYHYDYICIKMSDQLKQRTSTNWHAQTEQILLVKSGAWDDG